MRATSKHHFNEEAELIAQRDLIKEDSGVGTVDLWFEIKLRVDPEGF